MPAWQMPTCSWSSTITTCRSRRRSARSTAIWRAFSPAAASTPHARRAKRSWDFSPLAAEFAKRAEEHVKGMLTPGTLFEEFGFNYIGPIDGHDLESLVPTLHNLQEPEGSAVPACRSRRRARATSWPRSIRFSTTGWRSSSPRSASRRSERRQADLYPGFWRLAVRHGGGGPELVGITPAMREGSGMVRFSERSRNAI